MFKYFAVGFVAYLMLVLGGAIWAADISGIGAVSPVIGFVLRFAGAAVIGVLAYRAGRGDA